MDRRSFIAASGTLTAALAVPVFAQTPMYAPKIKAIVFDSFPIFNPRPVFQLCTRFFPEKGNDLVKEWRTKQFEYTWLRSMSDNYTDFLSVTEDALRYAANLLNLEINQTQQKQLVDAYYQLETWPEAPAVLAKLKNAGYRLGILSNFTPKMLTINTTNSHIGEYFEHLLSVETVKKYKPDPIAYHMATHAFNLSKEEILFVPFAGWDAAGGKKFGYKTFWVNRMGTPLEELGTHPDGTGKDLND